MTSILVVDDNPALLPWLVDRLASLLPDATVRGASTCTTARDAFQEVPADILVVERHLVDGDGLELAMAMIRLTPALEIILTSTHRWAPQTYLDIERAIVKCLPKPYSVEEMVRTIQSAITPRATSRPSSPVRRPRFTLARRPEIPRPQHLSHDQLRRIISVLETDIMILEQVLEPVPDRALEIGAQLDRSVA